MPHKESMDVAAGPFGDHDQPEVLYRSERVRVSRVLLPGESGSAIRKELLGAGSAQRLRHERAIIERLVDVEGVPNLVHRPGDDAILMTDSGGVVLAETLVTGPWPIADLLPLARRLTHIVAAVHRHGVVHKDINPANIIVSGPDRAPTLIDFDLATTFAEERPNFAHQSEVAGTLAYLAPEQTGRTGRPVDQRADLYALGATFYALATGQTPFSGGDALQLIHDHLARVPASPDELNPLVPAGLAAVILRLLEKEPDRRYQGADGLAHDLDRLGDGTTTPEPFALGERDFPLRLTGPSRLIGRQSEIAALTAAFATAVRDRGPGVLVAGAPGVGKTALIDELRQITTTGGGWFVRGKFDQYRQDLDCDAVAQAMRALGRLLLAEPEPEMAVQRARILDGVGSNAGLLAAMLPEFALLLGIAPEFPDPDSDPFQMASRLNRCAIALLGAVASAERPVVMVLDDVQWAASTPIGFIDAVMLEGGLPGLLIVSAYRDAEVDAAHPLSACRARWEQLDRPPLSLRLTDLPATDLGELLAEMLRLDPGPAAGLAEVLAARTGGNPYDTVELVNALRRDAILQPGPDGWSWDATAIRRYVGRGDVVDLLTARIDGLPAPSRSMLEIMACLGGRVDLELLGVAGGLSRLIVEEHLAPALEDGLLVMEYDPQDAVRFRHDRVQQAAYRRLKPAPRRVLHLALARRLAEVPELAILAAEQYLPCAEAVADEDERRMVVALFRQAGASACLINYPMAVRFLSAALAVLAPVQTPADSQLVVALETELHTALYSLGRLEEADEVYAAIERGCDDALRLARAGRIQISSLTHRGRQVDAVALGVTLLSRLGVQVPDREELGPALQAGVERICHWAETVDLAEDLARPEVNDPRAIAIANVSNPMQAATFTCDPMMMCWLVTQNQLAWAEKGPFAAVLGSLAATPFVTIAMAGNYRAAYRAVQHLLAIGQARGYELETSLARMLFAIVTMHWKDPLEDGIRDARRALEGLLLGGELQMACFTYVPTLAAQLECGATVDTLAGEADAALEFSKRTGNDDVAYSFATHRQLARVLSGQTRVPDGFADEIFDEVAHLRRAENPSHMANHHLQRALLAAIFGHGAELEAHVAALLPVLPGLLATYSWARARLMHGLALAQQITTADPDDRVTRLAEFDDVRDWLAARAQDAPANFAHLVSWLDAERAWAIGDLPSALIAFDAALLESRQRQRPWHRAMIAERAGRCHLAQGLQHTGETLLREARGHYQAWGATAKVARLGLEYPFLRPATGVIESARPSTVSMSADSLDLLSLLRASQALSSETNLDRLRYRVGEVLTAMTGATKVQVLLWNDDAQTWFLSPSSDQGGAPVPLDEAGRRALLPLSVVRYVERTREALVVDDAGRDDRFAQDSYLAGLESCSLLAIPITTRGVPRVMLLLENHLARGAFSRDRLDAVMLITGQLTVSFENALVYASLEDKVARRTEALEAANQRLEVLSVTDALTGLSNRRHLEQVLSAEWQRAQRSQHPISAAMIDVDHFKLYNDRYGHLAGDECLRRVAAALRQSVRVTDVLARYGGEEFCIVLPDSDLDAAAVVAERARAAVAALLQPHAGSSHEVVTVSVGLATLTPSGQAKTEELIDAADARLYDAKRLGRNQVATRETSQEAG